MYGLIVITSRDKIHNLTENNNQVFKHTICPCQIFLGKILPRMRGKTLLGFWGRVPSFPGLFHRSSYFEVGRFRINIHCSLFVDQIFFNIVLSLLTGSSHVFTNPESTKFVQEILFYFIFWGCKVSFLFYLLDKLKQNT